VTPTPTKVVLVAVLATTLAVFAWVVRAQSTGTIAAGELSTVLWLLTGLFAVRVAGQILVVLYGPTWLPPMQDWNLVPYRVLLPVQLVMLGLMAWIDISISASSGPPASRVDWLGSTLVAFSVIYAATMAIRYAVRMRRRPEARWFGGTIPIVFHLVLATYLYAFGSFHAGL
jgi:hypothetical protein